MTVVERRRGRFRALWATTLGKKLTVALSGTVMALYVVAHMLGNLKATQGAGGGDPAIDRYAEWLRTLLGPALPRDGAVWLVRLLLIAALVLHVVAIVQLTRRNRAARPPGHPAKRQRSTLAARTMLGTGLFLLAFIVFHILQFTTRTIHPTPLHEGAVYANLHGAFQEWWLVLLYVAAAAVIGFHLQHALWSAAQTTGLDNPDRNPFWRKLASGTAVAVFVGFAIVPILFFTGALPEPV